MYQTSLPASAHSPTPMSSSLFQPHFPSFSHHQHVHHQHPHPHQHHNTPQHQHSHPHSHALLHSTTSHQHQHQHSHSQRPYPMASSSSCSPPLQPTPINPTKSLPHSRPKPLKKPSSSTTHKHKSVQMSLELKVERSKGFHAFFVPLARTLPPAPPSSPVLGSSSERRCESGGGDYFGGWDGRAKVNSQEQWVEDIDEEGGSSGMEVDSE